MISHQQFKLFSRHAHADHCQEWDSQYPLMERAWAYQEQVLSPRVIYFGHHEIFWQCNATSWCCCSPYPIQHGLKCMIAQGLDTRTPRITNASSSILACWERIVRYYSDKSITKEEDRLPALSGIARRFQLVRNSEYLAGLWEDNLSKDLCWMVSSRGRRPGKYLAPSWSWCSVFGSATCSNDSKLARVDVNILEVSCTPSTSDPTGAVSSGFIRISGFLLQGKLLMPSHDNRLIFRVRDVEFQFYADALYDDLAAIQSSNCTLYSLKVGRNKENVTQTLYVLILLKLKGLEEHFQRVGIAVLGDDIWKSRFEMKCAITII